MMDDRLIEGFAAAQGTMARQEGWLADLRAGIPDDPWFCDGSGTCDVECYECHVTKGYGSKDHDGHEEYCGWFRAQKAIREMEAA